VTVSQGATSHAARVFLIRCAENAANLSGVFSMVAASRKSQIAFAFTRRKNSGTEATPQETVGWRTDEAFDVVGWL